MFKNINKYLLILTIVLILFLLLILFFYINEKNILVQDYLNNIQSKLEKHKNKYETIVNSNYKVEHVNNIIVVKDFLENNYYKNLRNQFDDKQFESRDFILRKATGINFFNLHKENYNGILELYYSNEIIEILGNILNKPVQRISLSDPNACSLLLYTHKGDFIDWHLDYSNYYGDRYVVLLTLVNENGSQDDLSNNIFKYKYNNEEFNLKMLENSLVIFKGSEILHKSTAIEKNERRILLSMVFCDICQEKKNVFNILYEKSKNYILYGL